MAMADKDYYTVLGVNQNASDEEIKKKYRELAHKYHPDRPGGDEARFKELNEAYQTLSDKQKRQQYDMFRQYGGKGQFRPGARGSPFGNAGFGGDFNFDFGGGDMGGFGSLDDLLREFFVGMGGAGVHFGSQGRTRTQPRQTFRFEYQGPNNMHVTLDLTGAKEVTPKMKQMVDEFMQKFFKEIK